MSGGQGLFVLVVGVDLALGPLLTFVAYNPAKGRSHLRRDLAVIAVLQLAGLSYGLHTVYVVRPVALVFEHTRFRVVSAGDVLTAELPKARPEYRSLPLTGPWSLAVRPAAPGAERNEAIFLALQGVDTGQRPPFWVPYSGAAADAYAVGRPVKTLLEREPSRRESLEREISSAGIDIAAARFVPVMARGDWVAVLSPGGAIAGFLPADGFF